MTLQSRMVLYFTIEERPTITVQFYGGLPRYLLAQGSGGNFMTQ